MTPDKSSNIDFGAMGQKACQFILKVQSTTSIPEVWELFLNVMTETYPIEEARLSYKAGVLSKDHTSTPNKEKILTNESKVDNSFFLETTNEFDYRFLDSEILVYKRVEAYVIQVRLMLSDPAGVAALTGGNGPESHKEKILFLSQILINQVILLLKIENFEFHSIKDDITLAYNQKYLRTFIRNEIERCRRYPSIFSIAFFDLDNLKAVNEKFGHLVGTQVLKEVAEVLRQQVRKIDLLSRFGGDEFVIVLLKTNAVKTFEICSRIKQNLDSTLFLQDKNLNIKMTGCFGISSFPQDGNSVEELIKKADSAMYDVKRKGKNGIKIYEGV